MLRNPLLTRCVRHHVCPNHPGVGRGAAVAWNPRRGLALAPKAPRCWLCGSAMERAGGCYQGLLHPSWNPVSRITRRLYGAMVSRRA